MRLISNMYLLYNCMELNMGNFENEVNKPQIKKGIYSLFKLRRTWLFYGQNHEPLARKRIELIL